MEVLSKNLHRLISELVTNDNISYSGITEMDIILETFEYVIREKCLKGSTDEDILEYFKYKYKMFYFKAKNNNKLIKKLNSCQQSTEVKKLTPDPATPMVNGRKG